MIKLSKPNISTDDLDSLIKSIKSGNLVQGEFVTVFEKQVQKYLKTKHAVLVSSGTAALHLVLIALNIKNDDEIIAPSYTFPATTNVIELVGAKTVLVDINLSDFCINADKIEEKITKKTKAIIVVHEFGQPAEMDKIIALAKKYNLRIIEDAACAFGAEYEGKKVGTIGDIGCFSLHPRKAITTGEGGIVVTNNGPSADKIRALRNHGIVKNNNKVDVKYAGLNYRLTDFQAALAINQLKNIQKDLDYREKIVNKYNRGFRNSDLVTIPKLFNNRIHAFQSYHLLIDQKINRDWLIENLKKQGIESNYGAYAIHILSYYKNKYHYQQKDFPNAFYAHKHGLALPIGSYLNTTDINFIIKIINKIVK